MKIKCTVTLSSLVFEYRIKHANRQYYNDISIKEVGFKWFEESTILYDVLCPLRTSKDAIFNAITEHIESRGVDLMENCYQLFILSDELVIKWNNPTLRDDNFIIAYDLSKDDYDYDKKGYAITSNIEDLLVLHVRKGATIEEAAYYLHCDLGYYDGKSSIFKIWNEGYVVECANYGLDIIRIGKDKLGKCSYVHKGEYYEFKTSRKKNINWHIRQMWNIHPNVNTIITIDKKDNTVEHVRPSAVTTIK
jgi:hypothetical protein